jgi:hypothetical protein
MASIGLSKKNTYFRAAAVSRTRLYLALKDRKLDRQNVLHARIALLEAGTVHPVKDVNWAVAGMCIVGATADTLIVAGESGKVLTVAGGSVNSEAIDPPPFQLRFCGAIAGQAYACGMKRQVFRREGSGQWIAMHAPPGEGKRVAGFEAIAGFHADELYAVGWEGEIWRFAGNAWEQIDSPVNRILTGVCCAPDGLVYACGQDGILLRGRGDRWEVLEQAGLEDDFWDLRWHDNGLFVASMSTLYRLRDRRLSPVDFGADAPASCYKLCDADGVLWSVGQENLYAFDGTTWTRWD